MATLAVQSIGRDSGAEMVLTPCAELGDTMPNEGVRPRRQLMIHNGSVGAVDVVITPGGNGALEVGDGSLVNLESETIPLAAGDHFVTGFLSPNRFGDAPTVLSTPYADVSVAWVELGA
jgi:hypothetical protein